MTRYRWINHGGQGLRDVGVLPDGTLHNPNGYPDELVREAVRCADERCAERKRQATAKGIAPASGVESSGFGLLHNVWCRRRNLARAITVSAVGRVWATRCRSSAVSVPNVGSTCSVQSNASGRELRHDYSHPTLSPCRHPSQASPR